GEERDIGTERLRRGLGRGIVVMEIVDHFLGPDRRRLGQDILVQRGAHPAVGSSVDIDREGRNRRFADDVERILGEGGELVAALVMVGRAPYAPHAWRGRGW